MQTRPAPRLLSTSVVLAALYLAAIGALIVPRPLLLLNGEIDPIFPITGSKAQYVTVAAAYAAAGQPDACHLHIHPGGHAYALPPSLSWFKRWLG